MRIEEERRSALKRRLTDIEAVRSEVEPDLKELERYFAPRKARFNAPGRRRKTGTINADLLNGTPAHAITVMKSGMLSGHTSPSRPWFKLITPDPDLMEYPGVRAWLYGCELRLRDVFARSNVYNALGQTYGDLGSFGTSAMGVFEDRKDTIRCYPYLMGSYAIANGPRLTVDTWGRTWEMSAVNAAQNFGYSNLSAKARSAVDAKRMDEMLTVSHLIQPNYGRKPGMADSRNMAVESVYWEQDFPEENALRVSGFQEMPVLVPRWETVGEEAWGDAPSLIALGDAKQLQFEELAYAQMLDKLRAPAYLIDPALKNKTQFGPNGKNYVARSDGGRGVEPVYVPDPNALRFTAENIARLEERINRYLFVDIFLMLATSDRRQITAREVEEKHGEKLLMLGPILERLADELLDPLINRTFNIMLRTGMIPRWPSVLDRAPVKIEYISILAQAQKAVATQAIESVTAYAGNLAGVDPEALDKLDIDQAIDEYAQLKGAPPTIVRSDEAVAARRRQRAEAQQAMARASMMKEAAGAANQLGNTPMGTGSALDKLVAA